MALPCTHFRPASITLHFDESIMIGTREMSGSDAIRFRKRVIAACESSIASSMLMSMTWAPFSTCWRATDSASSNCSFRIMRANAFEPVTLVRSPTLTNSEVVVDGERLQARQAQRDGHFRHGARRAADSSAEMACDVFRRGAAAAAGDVDEAGVGEFAQQGRGVGRQLVEAGVAHRVGQAGVRVDADEGVGDLRQLFGVRAHQGRAQRAVQADRQRLGVAHRIPEGGTVWPDRMRPEASVTVPEIMIGRRGVVRMLVEIQVDREQRRLAVQGVEDGLDQQHVDAAVDQAAHLLVVAATSWSKVTLRAAGSFTSGEIEAVFGVGPRAPATKRGLSGVCICRRRRAPAWRPARSSRRPGGPCGSRPGRRWWRRRCSSR
jgi:hypothetical protein